MTLSTVLLRRPSVPYRKSLSTLWISHAQLVTDAQQAHSPIQQKDLRGPFPAKYESALVESGWYEWWRQRDLFTPKRKSGVDKTFSMVLPPPNVTGTLHLGHALTATLQDALVRFERHSYVTRCQS